MLNSPGRPSGTLSGPPRRTLASDIYSTSLPDLYNIRSLSYILTISILPAETYEQHPFNTRLTYVFGLFDTSLLSAVALTVAPTVALEFAQDGSDGAAVGVSQR